jgi:hypothetical protein
MLPPPPAAVVDATTGEVRVGAYEGHLRSIDWRPVAGSLFSGARAKRWQFMSLFTDEVAVACAIADLGWMASTFLGVLDRQTRKLVVDLSLDGLPGFQAQVATHPGEGSFSSWLGRGLELRLHRPASTPRWSFAAQGQGLEIEADLDADGAPPTLCAIAVPPGGRGNSTHKTVGLPASGRLTAGGKTWSLDGGFASLDYTNGLLARDTRWRWASATSGTLGLNLVSGFNGAVENAVWVNGQLVKVGEAQIEIDPRAPLDRFPVRTVDDVVDLVFTPEGRREQHKDFFVARSVYVAPFGTWKGVIRPPGGAEVEVDGLPGLAEDHVARW